MTTNTNPPTGADGDHVTFCRLCEAFCGIVATVRDGRVIKIAPDRANPHSQGHICVKGVAAAEIMYDPDRVTQPLKRVGDAGKFVPVSWDEALDDIASRLKAIRKRHGGEAIASYFGNPAGFSSETYGAVGEMMVALGSTRNWGAGSQDTNARVLANYIAYGAPWTTGMPDLPNCDFLIVMGANPMVSNGSLMCAPRVRHDFDEIAKRGRVVVVDPRRSETASRYEHVPIRPNGDVWLLLAMLRVLVDEGLIDEAMVARDIAGWPLLREQVLRHDVAHCAAQCDIPADTIRKLARDFVRAKRAALYSRIGICRGPYATLTNLLLTAFNALTGGYGVEGGTMFGLQVLSSPKAKLGGYGEASTRTGGVPSVSTRLASAMMPDDILLDGPDKVRALLVTCGNPMLSAPGGERLEQALQSLELLVSFDLYVNETNRHAHYILPGVTFLERADVPLPAMLHLIRPFMQYSDAVVPAVGDARNDYDTFLAIARRMGLGAPSRSRVKRLLGRLGWTPRPLAMLDLRIRLGPAGDRFGLRQGWSLQRLRQHPHGVMVDVPHSRLSWKSRIVYPDQKLHVWHELLAGEFARLFDEKALAAARFRLLSQRDIRSLNSWMHNVPKLVRSQQPALTMHPADAAELALSEGDHVRMSTDAGSLTVPVKLSDEVVRGAVCYPHGWGHRGGWLKANETSGVNVNVLLGLGLSSIERISGTSLIDGLEVSIEKASFAGKVASSPAVADMSSPTPAFIANTRIASMSVPSTAFAKGRSSCSSIQTNASIAPGERDIRR